jgi:hypothetical protein
MHTESLSLMVETSRDPDTLAMAILVALTPLVALATLLALATLVAWQTSVHAALHAAFHTT